MKNKPDLIYYPPKVCDPRGFFMNRQNTSPLLQTNLNSPFSDMIKNNRDLKIKELKELTNIYSILNSNNGNSHPNELEEMFKDIVKLWKQITC